MLREWLTPDEWAKLIQENVRLKDDVVCYSGDLCDSNMAMEEAFKRSFGRGPVLPCDEPAEENAQEDNTLWNEAWGRAKKHDFFNDEMTVQA